MGQMLVHFEERDGKHWASAGQRISFNIATILKGNENENHHNMTIKIITMTGVVRARNRAISYKRHTTLKIGAKILLLRLMGLNSATITPYEAVAKHLVWGNENKCKL